MPTDPAEAARRARADLDALKQPDTIAGSALAAYARRMADHFAARDAQAESAAPPDPVEVWGTRIGRTLSLLGCSALAIYLYLTYAR